MPLITNAQVTSTRAGVDVYGPLNPRTVFIEWPSYKERIAATGGMIDAFLIDEPDGDFQQEDVITIVALDGFVTLPQTITYGAKQVTYAGGLLPEITVELIGDYV